MPRFKKFKKYLSENADGDRKSFRKEFVNKENDDAEESQTLTGSDEKRDVFKIDGPSTDYTIAKTEDGLGYVITSSSNPDVSDTLYNFDVIRFTDGRTKLTGEEPEFIARPIKNVVVNNADENETLEGVGSKDIFIIRGNSSDYEWEAVEGGYRIYLKEDPTQADTILGFEKVKFNDGKLVITDEGAEFVARPSKALNARKDRFEGEAGDTIEGDLLANDRFSEDAEITASLNFDAKNGDVTVNEDGTFSYQPNEGFTGRDVFVYQIEDENGNVNYARVVIKVEEAEEESDESEVVTLPEDEPEEETDVEVAEGEESDESEESEEAEEETAETDETAEVEETADIEESDETEEAVEIAELVEESSEIAALEANLESFFDNEESEVEGPEVAEVTEAPEEYIADKSDIPWFLTGRARHFPEEFEIKPDFSEFEGSIMHDDFFAG